MTDSPTSSDQNDNFMDRRAGSGIVVLSASMQLLHMNRQASELANKINAIENGGSADKFANGVLPAALTELCGEIIKALHTRTEAKEWEQFELKRVAGDQNRPILLRGFRLPDRGGVHNARLVVTMEELGRKTRSTPTGSGKSGYARRDSRKGYPPPRISSYTFAPFA